MVAKKAQHIEAPPDRLSATLALEGAVGRVRLVSPSRAKALCQLGIETVRDLVRHYPRRYIDLSSRKTVESARIGEQCTIEGSVFDVKLKKPKPRLSLVEITIVDGTGTLIVTMFRQPWLMDSLKPGMRLAVAGKLEFGYGYKRMTNPYLEDLGDGAVKGLIIPVHPATEAISAALMRRLVENALALTVGVYDPIPLDLRMRYRLMGRGAALRCIHFPESMDDMRNARRRLAYEELLLLELHLIMRGRERDEGKVATAHVVDGERVRAYAAALPFTLTEEQKQAVEDFNREMSQPRTANHLLLGDVGTGKTVVAGFAIAAAVDTGGQALLAAPTEVLALQHGVSLGGLLEQAGISYGVLTGSTSASDREAMIALFSEGLLDVLIGTHALLEDDVRGARITLVVIDEQQRFGVEQRACLLGKGEAPDALYLTATPIPRSLALAIYGDLTHSYIKHRPNDTVNRTTRVLEKSRRGVAYDAACAALARGEQAYVVCPLVGIDAQQRDDLAGGVGRGEPDEEYHPVVSIEHDADLQGDNVAAASREARMLQETTFVDYRVELLHGKMSPSEKHRVMEEFRQGLIDVLVATTVIEVGVDVPNATVMIIEDADRFGLSQLHQLRGRVGRGEKAAEVFLVSGSKHELALRRLAVMESTDDGFELATHDLSLRREGDILGNRQHGLSSLKLVNVARDVRMIEAARLDAIAILDEDPHLESDHHRALARELRATFGVAGTPLGG